MASKYIRSFVLILFALCFAGSAPASEAKQDKSTGAGQAKAAPAKAAATVEKVAFTRSSDPNLYAGTDTCVTCHEDINKSHEKGPHWKTELSKNGPAYKGCEGCHGPGKAHAEGGGDTTKIVSFKNLSKAESTKICLDCHQQNEEHANYLRSQHARNDVGCVDCHSTHKAKVQAGLLKASQPQLCYGCHQNVKPDFSKPFHHKVNEGLIGCTNCHSAHGGQAFRQLRASAGNDQVCYGCHTDKQGPFVYNHAPVKAEGCGTCHTPHGSAIPRLLTRSNVNQLCMECHTDILVKSATNSAPSIPSLHNQSGPRQACTSCHAAIHGSNSDATLFKF